MQRPTAVLINTMASLRVPFSFMALLFFSSSLSIVAHPGFNFNWGAFGGNGGQAGFGGNGGQGDYGGNGGQGAFGGNGGQGAFGGNGGQGAFGGNGGQGAIGGNGGQGAIGGNGGQGPVGGNGGQGAVGRNGGQGALGGNGGQGAIGGNRGQGAIGGNGGQGAVGGNGGQGAVGGNGGQGTVGGNGGQGAFGGTGGRFVGLFPEFYQYSCPQANDIVMSVLHKAIANEPRMAASLLRLHFHDCFVQGCDASVLLDDTTTIRSEKQSGPNKNSLRGFEVIDEIKAKLEQACPEVVSCADILALAARGSTVLSGGPNWVLPLGRRDSKTASLSGSNKNIPAPNSTLQNLITFFNRQGLNEVDLVALSGSHTIGVARCVTFRQRLYNQNGNNQPDETLERNYYNGLKIVCPKSGGDNIISPLDLASPIKFDNTYFKLLLWGRGLLNSDEVLLTGKGGKTTKLVKQYAEDEGIFFQQFAQSMVKMGNISPLSGYNGEVRKNCRQIN